MRKSRFTEAQIVAIVGEYDLGTGRAVGPQAWHSREHDSASKIEIHRHEIADVLMMNRFRTIFEVRVAAQGWRNE